MKAFLVFDRYGSYDSPCPRIETVEMIFIGDDQKDAVEAYCQEMNKKCGGGFDYEEIDAKVIMSLK